MKLTLLAVAAAMAGTAAAAAGSAQESEVADYWPGLDAPVEVPAELIEKHF